MLKGLDEISNKRIIRVCCGILHVNCQFLVINSIAKKMIIINILSKRELLYVPNFCIHINFMMRTEATEDKSHYGHSVHFFINPSKISPGVLV